MSHKIAQISISTITIFIIGLMPVPAMSANVFFTASDYNCVTDYVWESDGARNNNVPNVFKAPIISLTDTPEFAVIKMPNHPSGQEGKLFKFFGHKKNDKFGAGLHYRSDQGSNFLDIYANGKVVFGVVGERYLSPTIKMYCRRIPGAEGYW